MADLGPQVRLLIERYLRSAPSTIPKATLEKLIRIRDYLSLDPDAREQVKGALGSSLLRIPEPEEEVQLIILERGLAIIDSGLWLYVSTALDTQWQGPGMDWGWATEHAQGILDAGAVDCTQLVPVNTAPTWSGAETLVPVTRYASRAVSTDVTSWATNPYRDPAASTGLARVLMEGWAAYRDISSEIPPGWPDHNPRWYGLIRERRATSQTLHWWLIYLGPQGCKAVELTPDPLVACLASGLYSGAWSGSQEQQILAEAWVIRTLERYPGATEYDLLSDTELDPVFGGNYFPLVWGFHFSPQKWDETSQEETKAVIFTKENGPGEAYWNTRIVEVAFQFNAGIPQAIVTTTATGSNIALNAREQIWYGPDPLTDIFFPVKHTDSMQDGPIWVRYRDDGIKITRYLGETEVVEQADDDPGAAYNTCGGQGSIEHDVHLYLRTSYSACGFDETSGEQDFESGAGQQKVYQFTAGAGVIKEPEGDADPPTFRACTFNSTTRTDNAVTQCDSLDQGDVNKDTQVFLATCTYHTEAYQWQEGGGFGAGIIIGRTDPTILISVKDKSRSLTMIGARGWEDTEILGSGLLLQGNIALVAALGGRSGDAYDGTEGQMTFYDREGPDRQGNPANCLSCVQSNCEQTYWFRIIDGLFGGNDYELHPPESTVVETEVTYSTASTEKTLEITDSADRGDWFCWSRRTECGALDFIELGPEAIASYGGDLLYTETPKGDLINDEGYNDDALLTGNTKRFSGSTFKA